MFLSFSGFLFLVSFMENKKRRTLIISAIFISSGCLARYLGVCAALSASLFLLLEKTYEKKRVLRIKNTLTFLSIAAAPILLWLIRNIIVSGAATGRRDAVPGYTGSYLWRLFDTVSGWFIPPQVPFELRVAGLILIILILGAGYNFIQQKNTEKKNKKFRKKQQIQPDNAYLMHILTVYIIVYIGMIFAASKFAKIDPPDDRLLAPLMPCLFALGFLILYKIYQSIETTQFRYAVKAVAAIFLLGTFAGAFVWTRSAYLTGTGGFSRLEWKQSRTVDWLKRNPLPDVLISNCPEAIYLFAGKEAKMLPMRRERIPLDEIMERIVRLNATVIVFDLVKWRDHLISAKELLETGQIKVLQKFDDGMLLGK
jgi:heme A synthase